MARRSGLGKGLGALIPAVSGETESAYRQLPVSSIKPSPQQPRTSFDEEALSALAASVRELGVLQPVLVREVGDGAFQLIAGSGGGGRPSGPASSSSPPSCARRTTPRRCNRPWSRTCSARTSTPSRRPPPTSSSSRTSSSPTTRWRRRVGKSRAAVSNSLRLFQLPPQVQRLLMEGSLSAGHARALLGTPDRAYQEALAKRAVAEGLSVRAVEEAVRQRGGGGSEAPRPDATSPRSLASACARPASWSWRSCSLPTSTPA